MNLKKEKRNALVTGGVTGIGLEVVKELKKEGCLVIANYPPHMKDTAFKVKEHYDVDIAEFDASDYEAVEKAINTITNQYGDIDILVNNAGITKDSFLHKMKIDEWTDVLRINLDSVFNCCRVMLPNMRKNQFGRIINISSVNALKGQVGQTNYCASKAAIIGFTKALALENASKGVTVNAIAPGYVNTDMVKKIDSSILETQILTQIPMNRLAKTIEIASLIRHLIKDESAYLTGQTISINGGMYFN
ncbi:beta-ketoacyl-ACP reductase [bacterium]|nr:beta-ketoacyl-ACP reductase [bacterium]|tara:strand:- start:1708 stop:2451 length:744 start_codon:yes stop_codon:yes gene_type:complete